VSGEKENEIACLIKEQKGKLKLEDSNQEIRFPISHPY
jgi:hypothetical protein